MLAVKKPIAVRVIDPLGLSYSESDAPVVLQSTPACPLLVDPEQRELAEHFGIVRARLLNARGKYGIGSIVIASPQKGDGKSFTALNLAISLAQLQHLRILLVDGDLRQHGITRTLGLEQRSGLGDYLRKCAPFAECVHSTSLHHLEIAPAGNVVNEALPGILEGAPWPDFVREAKQEFDLIVIDSVPASAPIADFELLLGACDAALLVVSIRKTSRDATDLTVQQMQGKLIGVVVNNKQSPVAFDYGFQNPGKRST